MFKFSIVVDGSDVKLSDFYNDSQQLGVRGMSRFLTWLSLNGLDLHVKEIHTLIKNGVSGVYTMTITHCESIDELTACE